MNPQAFIQYISYHLRTNVSTYNSHGDLLDSYCVLYDFTDPIIEQLNLKELLVDFSESPYPKLISVNDQIFYSSISVGKYIYIIGPVKLIDAPKIKDREDGYKIENSWLKLIFSSTFREFMNDILLIYNLHQKEMITIKTLVSLFCIDSMEERKIQRRISSVSFDRRENELPHNPYDHELREMKSIELGDVEQLEKCWEEEFTFNYGSLAKNRIRNVKNLCIALITLASRAAIRGGLHPEIAFTLCDSYVQEIEECSDSASCSTVAHKAEKHYAMMVADIRYSSPKKEGAKQSPHINKCKDYIFTHLHNKITVQEIAQKLNLNANYLSDLFKKQEGHTIKEFIMEEKIKLAKNMLMYSPYTYNEIAAYLGFVSQSHLGTYFKKITNMTLKEYREKYGVETFVN